MMIRALTRQLVRSVAEASNCTIQETTPDIWQVTIPIGALRKQTVTINFAGEDEEGHRVISYTSICGAANDKIAVQLLKYNLKMVHGAFAVQSTEAGDFIVVQANQLADTADPLEVTRLLTAVAWQADKVEAKLGGENDQY